MTSTSGVSSSSFATEVVGADGGAAQPPLPSQSSEGSRLELLSTLYAKGDVPNLQYIYQQQCMVFSCRPNSDILRLLPGGGGGGGGTASSNSTRSTNCSRTTTSVNGGSAIMDLLRLRSLDLSGNAVGRVGMLPILYTLTNAPALEQLSLADNFLSNETILTFVELFRRHPSLTTIDLSGNPISQMAGKALLKYVQSNPTCEMVLLDRTLINKGLIRRIQGIAKGNATGSRNSINNKVGEGAATYFSSRLKELLFDARVEEDTRERLELENHHSSERQLLCLQESREYSDLELRESLSLKKVRNAEVIRKQLSVIKAEGYVRGTITDEDTHIRSSQLKLQLSNVSLIKCEVEEEPMGREGVVEEKAVEWNDMVSQHKKEAVEEEERRKTTEQHILTEEPTATEDEPITIETMNYVIATTGTTKSVEDTTTTDITAIETADTNGEIKPLKATNDTAVVPIEVVMRPLSTSQGEAAKQEDDEVVLSARGVGGIAATVASGLDTTTVAANNVDDAKALPIRDHTNTTKTSATPAIVTASTTPTTDTTVVSPASDASATMSVVEMKPLEVTRSDETAKHEDDEVVLSARGVGGIAATVASGLDTVKATIEDTNKPVDTTMIGPAEEGVRSLDTSTHPVDTNNVIKPIHMSPHVPTSTVGSTKPEAVMMHAPRGRGGPVAEDVVYSARGVNGTVTTIAIGLDTLTKPTTDISSAQKVPPTTITEVPNPTTPSIYRVTVTPTSVERTLENVKEEDVRRGVYGDTDNVMQSVYTLSGIPVTIADAIDEEWLATREHIVHRVNSVVFSYATVSSRMENDSQSTEYDPYDEL